MNELLYLYPVMSDFFCYFLIYHRCLGWGHNLHQQLGAVDSLTMLKTPDVLSVDEKIKKICSGKDFTVLISAKNSIYLAGKFQRIIIPKFRKIPWKTTTISSMHITRFDDIYVITEDQDVLRSKRIAKIEEFEFENVDLGEFLSEGERVVKIASGDNCRSIVTDRGRLLTTFDEKSPFIVHDHYQKINKFQDYTVQDVESGTAHMLVQTVPRKKDINKESDMYRTFTIDKALNDDIPKIKSPTPPLDDDEVVKEASLNGTDKQAELVNGERGESKNTNFNIFIIFLIIFQPKSKPLNPQKAPTH